MGTILTEHFTLEEMSLSTTGARLGLDNTIPVPLISNARMVAERLEKVRAHFGQPVRVLSCYRAPAVNAAVGGSKTSAHRFALAADFIAGSAPLIAVARWCAENIEDFDQVIYEFGQWVHIGFSNTPRRQILTAVKENGRTVYHQGLEA